MLIAAAILAPFLGAALYPWLHGHPTGERVVDRSLLLAVPVLVGWHVLDHGLDEAGWTVLLALAAGAATPWGIERLSRRARRPTDTLSLVAGLSGLVLHALFEGAALPGAQTGLLLAVVLHRAPVGFIVWWMVSPRYGRARGIGALSALAGATLVGAAAGGALESWSGPGIALYQAFVSGSLLHVVLHQGPRDHAHG